MGQLSKTGLSNEDTEDKSDEVKTTLLSRNVTINGRRTSVRLEPEMWNALYEIAKRERCTIHDISSLISMRKREKTSLTAAIRVFLMLYFRAAATEDGHAKAGHGNFEFMRNRAGVPKAVKHSENKANKGDDSLLRTMHISKRYSNTGASPQLHG